MMAQEPQLPPHIWETYTEFSAPGFRLVQPRWAFREPIYDQEISISQRICIF